MRADTERYLEQFCDTATAGCAPGLPPSDCAAMVRGAGGEPFGFGAALRFSPARTKAVMRELLQHNLLGIAAVRGEDGRYELRLTPNGETARWYARVLRTRRRGTGKRPGEAGDSRPPYEDARAGQAAQAAVFSTAVARRAIDAA